MKAVLAQLQYMPDSWKGNAHKFYVHDEFASLFQYKMVRCSPVHLYNCQVNEGRCIKSNVGVCVLWVCVVSKNYGYRVSSKVF